MSHGALQMLLDLGYNLYANDGKNPDMRFDASTLDQIGAHGALLATRSAANPFFHMWTSTANGHGGSRSADVANGELEPLGSVDRLPTTTSTFSTLSEV